MFHIAGDNGNVVLQPKSKFLKNKN